MALWAWEKRVKTCWILAALIFWYSLHQPLNLWNGYSICNHLPFSQYEIILHFRLLKWQCLFEDPVEDPVSSGSFSSVGAEGEESLSKEHLSIAGPWLNRIFPYWSASCVSSADSAPSNFCGGREQESQDSLWKMRKNSSFRVPT